MVSTKVLPDFSRMHTFEEARAACKAARLSHQSFSFSGTCKGTTEGVPYTDDGTDTPHQGFRQDFHRCIKKQGSTLTYQGAQWIVAWNSAKNDLKNLSWVNHDVIIVRTD